MNRIFVDMDGVAVDFDGYCKEVNLDPQIVKKMPLSYFKMKPIVGALEAIRQLRAWGYEVWFATKPPTAEAHAYADKVLWILSYIPEMKRNIIITHDKGLLGDEHDWLIDDRPHKAKCLEFKGKLIPFKTSEPDQWDDILARFKPKHIL